MFGSINIVCTFARSLLTVFGAKGTQTSAFSCFDALSGIFAIKFPPKIPPRKGAAEKKGLPKKRRRLLLFHSGIIIIG